MDTSVLERRFAEIGARVKVDDGPWLGVPQIDVRVDRRGEYFDLWFVDGEREVELQVVDVNRADRHLLLLVRDGQEQVPVRPRRASLVRRGGAGVGTRRDRRRLRVTRTRGSRPCPGSIGE